MNTKRKQLILLAMLVLAAMLLCSCQSEPVAQPAAQPAAAAAVQTAAPKAQLSAFEPINWDTVAEAPASDFTYEVVQDNDPLGDGLLSVVRLTSYTGNASIVKMPDMIDGMYVRQSVEALFQNNTTITHAALPKYLRTGAQGASTPYMFEGCTSLVQVRMPEDCALIPGRMFRGCTALREVAFPVNKPSMPFGSVDVRAFENCSSLTSITLPSDVRVISDRAFEGCTSLETVIARSVSCISDFAFSGCSALTTLEICGDMPILNGPVFDGCTSLKKVTILRGEQPSNTTLVEDNGGYYIVSTDRDGSTSSTLAFVLPGYEGDSITLRADTKEIGPGAFASCGFTSFEIPAFVEKIETFAFYDCQKLESVSFAAGSQLRTLYSSSFQECPVLQRIDLSQVSPDFDMRDDFDNLPALKQIVYPGEDPNATPAPSYTAKEITEAIEAALAPLAGRMEAAGYSASSIKTGDNRFSQVYFDTHCSSKEELDAQLLRDIAVAVVNTPQAKFSSTFRDAVNQFDFSQTGSVDVKPYQMRLEMGYRTYVLYFVNFQ